jgi:hypothetical protein
MKPPILTIIFFLSIEILSCTPTVSPDTEIESLVKKIEMRSSKMSEKDWQEADQKIELLQLDIENSNHLSELERTNANKLLGKYAALRIKSGIKSLEKEFKGISEKIDGMFDELADTTSN